MSETDTSRTVVYAEYGGRRRRFCLPLDEISELERVCGVGIGAIAVRLSTNQFSVNDVLEPIRLGLEGGGCSALEAEAITLRYRPPLYPIAEFTELAARIIGAALYGVPRGKDESEGSDSPDPATSRSTTKPAGRSDGRPSKSEG
ncbi:gene transfer agent family protein [Methylobacterium gnaphalii]|uniref:Gene transfer agent family protein n=1 Tax=Methylobacterium gnaphalii TaxID=1010610 RepID=A0A512JQM2_9HYPH|nr:gene transfer agent family protein [Methylobacterium gnaphalii]GEP12254.1 hypothetical protein MGN01_40990 [Methylobacterium gnaphalii]GJD68742.1 hypothetical protein MMMDOFMJ_1666 [Methylobacterium gnaphalii]GLS49361.1 hypothetical protein GCM10007885_22090 [Methylobacterium gnaphalii]